MIRRLEGGRGGGGSEECWKFHLDPTGGAEKERWDERRKMSREKGRFLSRKKTSRQPWEDVAGLGYEAGETTEEVEAAVTPGTWVIPAKGAIDIDAPFILRGQILKGIETGP